MEHLLVALWGAPGADATAVETRWVPEAVGDPNVESCTLSFAEADQGRFAAGDPVDVLIALGLERAHDLDDVPARGVLYKLAREVNVWRVEPRRQIVSDEPTTLNMVSFVTRA